MSSVSFRGKISPLNGTDDISFLLSPAHHVISLELSMAILMAALLIHVRACTSGDIHSEVRQLDIVYLKACATFSDLCAKWFGAGKVSVFVFVRGISIHVVSLVYSSLQK